jgi:hypothetical protein
VLEALGHFVFIELARELAKADERNATTLEVRLPSRIHAGDVMEFGIRVARVPPSIMAIGDVVQSLPGAARGSRATCGDAHVVRQG